MLALNPSVQSPAGYARQFNVLRDAVKRYRLIGNDSTDNTTRLQNMLDDAGVLYLMTPGTYRTGPLTFASNTYLYLGPGVVLKAASGMGANDRLFTISGVNNVHIESCRGAYLDGARAANGYTTGEQRHGVYIFDSSDVTVRGLSAYRFAGDGFYVGGNTASERVYLYDLLSDNNRRQGLSVVSAKHLRCYGGVFRSTGRTAGVSDGTAPSAGVDIEPNTTSQFLEDLVFYGPRCTGNDGAGFAVFLGSFNSSSCRVDLQVFDLYTSDNGHTSQSGSVRPGLDIRRCPSASPPTGRVAFYNCRSERERAGGVSIWDWDYRGPRLEFYGARISSPNQANAADGNQHRGAVNLATNGTTHTSTPGNVVFDDLWIDDSDGFLAGNSYAKLRAIGTGWKSVEFRNTRWPDSDSSNPWSYATDFGAICHTSDQPREVATTGNITITDGRFNGRLLTNYGDSDGNSIALPAAAAGMVGWRFGAMVRANQTIAWVPDAADKIYPLADKFPAGTVVRCSQPGGVLWLECQQIDATPTYGWMIVEQTGVWAIDPGSGDVPTYSVTNLSVDRSYDCDPTGLGYTFTNATVDRTLDCNSGITPSAAYVQGEAVSMVAKLDELADVIATATGDCYTRINELADVLGTVIKDLQERGIVGT